MSQSISLGTEKVYGLERVCRVWGIPRSRIYRRQKASPTKRGPKPQVSDSGLLEWIKDDLSSSPFKGEGHRKVHVRIRRKGTLVGRNRILRVMKQNHLLSPNRSGYRSPNPHSGRITTDAPNVMWGSDGTKIQTIEDGWVWVFSVADHWNTECLGWHVCKKGDRFAAYAPISQAMKYVYGGVEKGMARGLQLRTDNGSQYTSDYFLAQMKYAGIETSFGLVRQPETKGVAERFHRTLKEQILGGRAFKNADEVREAVGRFVELYNDQWLVAKRSYQSPREARLKYKTREVAA
jgi:putative transposase